MFCSMVLKTTLFPSCSIFNQCASTTCLPSSELMQRKRRIYKENQLIDFLYLKMETVPEYVEFMRFEVHFVSLQAKHSLFATSFPYTDVENVEEKSKTIQVSISSAHGKQVKNQAKYLFLWLNQFLCLHTKTENICSSRRGENAIYPNVCRTQPTTCIWCVLCWQCICGAKCGMTAERQFMSIKTTKLHNFGSQRAQYHFSLWF